MNDNLVDEVHRLLRPAGETGIMMEATSSSPVGVALIHQAVCEDLAAQETAMLHACEIDASAAELARLTGSNADLLVCVASLRENNTTLARVVAEHELAEQEMARLHAYETEVSTSKAHHLRRFNSYLIKLVMSLRNDTDARRETATPDELGVLDTAAAVASTPGLDPAVGTAIDEAAADEQMPTDYADTPPSTNDGNNGAGPALIVKELNVSDLETAKRAPAEYVPADAPGDGGEMPCAALPILVEQQAAHDEVAETPVQHAHHMRGLQSKIAARRMINAELLAYKQDAMQSKSCHIQHPSDRAERSGHVRALREQNAGHALAMHAWTNTSTDARSQFSAQLETGSMIEDKENVAPVPTKTAHINLEELLRIEALLESGKKPSWREVLGVGPSVPHKAVTSAYRKLSLRVHADKYGHELKERATLVMKEVNLAKEMADEEYELGTAGIPGLSPDFSGHNQYGPDHESWESADPEDARRRKEEEKQADEWTERMRAKAKERAQWREAGGAAAQKEAEDSEADELFDEILRECQM